MSVTLQIVVLDRFRSSGPAATKMLIASDLSSQHSLVHLTAINAREEDCQFGPSALFVFEEFARHHNLHTITIWVGLP